MRAFELIALLMVLAFLTPVASGEFHVAPDGNDANPGTVERPFATVTAARDAARAKGGTGLVIVLAPGRYFVESPIQLDDRDTGLTIKGEKPGAVAELYGGQPVTGWVQWKEGIWRAPVPKGKRFFNLIADGHCLTMAQNQTNTSSEGGEQGGHFDGTSFHSGNRGGTHAFDGNYDSGGGAGAPGAHGNNAVGGIGVELGITGTPVFYAAGGSALESTSGAKGGAGHRTGGTFGKATYQPVTENTGAGGQGGWGVPGNKGASGVVIVAYKPGT